MKENNFFQKSDPTVKSVAGFELPKGWWSRSYEYDYALKYNDTLGGYVANMGSGYTYRPLDDALACRAGLVYSVDVKAPIYDMNEHPTPENVKFVKADFSKQILDIPPQSLDRIFCVSVLEETRDVKATLKEFARLLTFGGLIVLTFDVQYDMNKPLGQWKGLKLETVLEAVEAADLTFREDIHQDLEGALFHEEWNLACYHCILSKP